MLETFKSKGFIHLRSVLDKDLLKYTRDLAVEMKYKYASSVGQLREWGTGVFWSGYEMASKLDERLYDSYTSPFMYELSSLLLETKEPYLFNDQIVVKLPGEGFAFEAHYDNQYGPDPTAAAEGKYKTVNISWILDDMPSETGPLICRNNQTGEYEELVAKAGDVVAIEGNTLHGSNLNTSNNIRGLYACVYSTHPIGDFHNNPNYLYPHFKGFYNEKFPKI